MHRPSPISCKGGESWNRNFRLSSQGQRVFQLSGRKIDDLLAKFGTGLALDRLDELRVAAVGMKVTKAQLKQLAALIEHARTRGRVGRESIQRTIQDAIENLLIKERLDLTPQLRELDGKVEFIELPLRMLVHKALGEDVASIPSHVAQRVHERTLRALKKNAAMDAARYATVGELRKTSLTREEGEGEIIMSKPERLRKPDVLIWTPRDFDWLFAESSSSMSFPTVG